MGWSVGDFMLGKDGPDNLRILKRQIGFWLLSWKLDFEGWKMYLSIRPIEVEFSTVSDLDRQRWTEIINITRGAAHWCVFSIVWLA